VSTPGWSVLESETLCDSPYLRVYREKIATPTRPDGVEWMVARRREAAVVAPQKKDGSFILIRQERVAVQRETWEFPAGQVDGDVNENTIAETALRELGEEAGVETLEGLEPLGLFYSSVGFTDERAHLFLAKNVTERAEGLDQDEHEAILEVRSFAPAELREMIASGVIVDANTLALFARMIAQGLL
jgi:ADP-ribose pyrophosphatase